MIKVATLFLARCKWYCLPGLFILLALATGCAVKGTSYLRQPISEKVIAHEVPRVSVAILPPISWESATCYYSTGKKFLREYLKKHSKNYQLGPSYLMTTWAEAAEEVSKLGSKKWQKRINKRFLELSSLWTSIRIKCGEVLLEHGFHIVPFREVDLAVRKIMPKFWDEDSRTSENVVLLCKEIKSSHVVCIETLSPCIGWFTWTGVIIRVEVYNQKGESEFVGLASASSRVRRNLQKAYANAIRIAMFQWLGTSEYIMPSTCNSLETHEVIIDGFWAAEGYNGKNSFSIPPGSKISIIVHPAIPTVALPLRVGQTKYAKYLGDKVKKLLEQRGYLVTQNGLLNELLRKPKDIPFSSSYNRTTAKLAEIAKSSGARYIMFCEVRGEYFGDAVVFLKIIDVETGNTWTQMLDEEKTKIPKVIVQQISTK